MPKLNAYSTKRIVLPSSVEGDEAFVVIRQSLLAGDVAGSDMTEKTEAAFEMFTKIIIEWNFTDETGKIAPITAENIKKLQLNDLLEIQKEIKMPTDAISDLKKKGLLSS